MSSSIYLSNGIKNSLYSLSDINYQLQLSQIRLSTGLKVNSPLDNPAVFYTANSLNQRAANLTTLLDNITKAAGALKVAQEGLTTINSLLLNAQSYANSALLASTGGSAPATPPVLTPGTEHRINTTTANMQAIPKVAGLRDGNYVVIWESGTQFATGQDGSGKGMYGQIYNSEGVAIGTEFRLNQTTSGNQYISNVAATSDGGFIATWQDDSVNGTDIRVRRYDSTGTALTGEFTVNSTTANEQRDPDIAVLSNGGFVVTYTDMTNNSVRARVFDSNNNPVGNDFVVTGATASNRTPVVAALKGGGFVITWAGVGEQMGSGYGIYARRYTDAGVAQGSEFLVNTSIADDQLNPEIASLENGGFVIAWQDENTSDFIRAQRYTAAGTAIGAEFQINQSQ